MQIDQLLSSQSGFTLGEWIELARGLGHTDAEKSHLELNARAQVTTWATYPPGQPWSHAAVPVGVFADINDYAIKQWGGLIREYQAVRLRFFVEQIRIDLQAGKTSVNIANSTAAFKREQLAWLQRTWNATELPPGPVGDPVSVSKALQELYPPPRSGK